MTHVDCGGRFEHWIIREHGYNFFRCSKCQAYWGGERVQQRVHQLLRTKVRPTLRRD